MRRIGLLSPKKAKLYDMDDTIDALRVEAEYSGLPPITAMYLENAARMIEEYRKVVAAS